MFNFFLPAPADAQYGGNDPVTILESVRTAGANRDSWPATQ